MKAIVKLTLAVTLVLLGIAAPAAATTITVTNVTLPFFETVSVAGFTDAKGHTFTGGSELAGQIVLTTNIGTLGTWCVDLFHTIHLGGSYTLDTAPLSTNNSGGGPLDSSLLSATQIQQIQSLAAYGNANLPAASDKYQFAAIVQAAIWQVEYLTTVTGDSAFNTALAALMALVPSLPAAGGAQLQNLNDASLFTVQNLFLTSEPGTLALVGGILVGLGLLRRRLRPRDTSSI